MTVHDPRALIGFANALAATYPGDREIMAGIAGGEGPWTPEEAAQAATMAESVTDRLSLRLRDSAFATVRGHCAPRVACGEVSRYQVLALITRFAARAAGVAAERGVSVGTADPADGDRWTAEQVLLMSLAYRIGERFIAAADRGEEWGGATWDDLMVDRVSGPPVRCDNCGAQAGEHCREPYCPGSTP